MSLAQGVAASSFGVPALQPAGFEMRGVSVQGERHERTHVTRDKHAPPAARSDVRKYHGKIESSVPLKSGSDTSKFTSSDSEALLMRDVMFALQGIDGTYIKFSEREDAFVLVSPAGVSRSTAALLVSAC